MLVTLFINIAVSLISFLIGLLPDADPTVTAFITNNFGLVKTLLEGANSFIDIPALFFILSVFIIGESLLLISKITQWVLANLSFGIFKRTNA
jgi:hypothetical protein